MTKVLEICIDDNIAEDVKKSSRELGLTYSEFIQQLVEERLLQQNSEAPETGCRRYSVEEVLDRFRLKSSRIIENF